MSRIHSGLGQEDCACVARSLRLAGYATSIRMEVAFWNILDEIAVAEGKTTARYLAALYEEALARDGEIANFTGVSDPYEEPLNPEVVLGSDKETVDESLAKVVAKLEELGYLTPASARVS